MVDENSFRNVMSQWASGVSVVTSVSDNGPVGVTASSFISVSLRPPLVAVSLATDLFTHDVINKSGVFAVNILRDGQANLGMLFAGLVAEDEDRFAGLPISVATTGSPILPNVMGWVDCILWAAYPGGDHTIFVGEVVDAEADDEATEPLLYYRRLWGRFSA